MMTLTEFAATVRTHATSEDCIRFGDRKVFLCTILETWCLADRATCPSRDQWEALLVEAHRAGLLTLARADLVSAMDPELVRWSEVQIRLDGTVAASFHFICL